MKKQKDKIALRITAAVMAVFFVGMIVFAVSIYLLYPVKYKNEINKYSAEYGFERRLIYAVVKTESGFDKDAESGAGASGLMQLMPSTADFIADKTGCGEISGADLFVPEINIKLGCAYLRYLADKFGDKKLALYAYNAGEGNVAAWLINPEYSNDGKSLYKIPFKETEQYYIKVARAEKIYGYIT